jgi:hypothetical protein
VGMRWSSKCTRIAGGPIRPTVAPSGATSSLPPLPICRLVGGPCQASRDARRRIAQLASDVEAPSTSMLIRSAAKDPHRCRGCASRRVQDACELETGPIQSLVGSVSGLDHFFLSHRVLGFGIYPLQGCTAEMRSHTITQATNSLQARRFRAIDRPAACESGRMYQRDPALCLISHNHSGVLS